MAQTAKTIAIGKRLRLAREQKGLSQAEVASAIDLHRPTISEMEAGRRKVSMEEFEVLAKLYDVPMTWLSCADTDEADERRDRRDMAALILAKLTTDELDLVLNVLAQIRQQKI